MAYVEPPDDGSATARLLDLAAQLRDAATQADRFDVAAKAAEAMALLTDADTPARDADQAQGRDTGNAVLRMLDGLGF